MGIGVLVSSRLNRSSYLPVEGELLEGGVVSGNHPLNLDATDAIDASDASDAIDARAAYAASDAYATIDASDAYDARAAYDAYDACDARNAQVLPVDRAVIIR